MGNCCPKIVRKYNNTEMLLNKLSHTLEIKSSKLLCILKRIGGKGVVFGVTKFRGKWRTSTKFKQHVHVLPDELSGLG